MTPPRKILTLAEVAERFRVSEDAVRAWTDADLLPHFRTPVGHRRFYEDEVDAVIESTRRHPAAAS